MNWESLKVSDTGTAPIGGPSTITKRRNEPKDERDSIEREQEHHIQQSTEEIKHTDMDGEIKVKWSQRDRSHLPVDRGPRRRPEPLKELPAGGRGFCEVLHGGIRIDHRDFDGGRERGLGRIRR